MAKVLPPWCKEAKKAMIDLDMSISDLADRIGMTRQYTSEIIHGRRFSEPAVKAISDVLNIHASAQSLADN